MLLDELRLEAKDYLNYLSIDEPTFLELLSFVTPIMKKQDTVMRTAITSHEGFTCNLRYLATGRSYGDFKFSFLVSLQALRRIIPEICNAIYEVLKDMKVSKDSNVPTC